MRNSFKFYIILIYSIIRKLYKLFNSIQAIFLAKLYGYPSSSFPGSNFLPEYHCRRKILTLFLTREHRKYGIIAGEKMTEMHISRIKNTGLKSRCLNLLSGF